MPPPQTSSEAPLHREIEWQLGSPDLERVRRWLEAHASIAGLKIAPRDTQQLADIYLDTQDFRIFRAGFALRMRANSDQREATLKALVSARKDVADRVELTEPLSRTTLSALRRLQGPVGARVHAVAGSRALEPLFQVRTRRQRFSVRGGGKEVGEIALDDTRICAPGGAERTRTQRVEVEAQGTDLAPLAGLVKELSTACDLQRAPASKFELGLRSTGRDPFAAVRPRQAETEATTGMGASMGAADAAFVCLRQLLSDWTRHEPAARLGDDPVELHQLRVAARRMDAVLQLFAPWLPGSIAGARATLKPVLRALGDVRDQDVQLANLASFREELGHADRRALEPLERHLAAGRARARRHMLQALDSLATRTCLEQLGKALQRPRPAKPPRAASRLAAVAPGLISERFRKVRKSFERLGDPVQPAQGPAPAQRAAPRGPVSPSLEDYHRARRRSKRLRYALEPLADLYGKPARQMLRTLRRMQDRLGAQQDVSVARARLAELASDPPEDFTPLTLFLAGRLAERHAAPGEETASRIDKSWRKLSSQRWKSLKRRMRDLQDAAETA